MGRMKELFMQLREEEMVQNAPEDENLNREYWESIRVSQQLAEHQSEEPQKEENHGSH